MYHILESKLCLNPKDHVRFVLHVQFSVELLEEGVIIFVINLCDVDGTSSNIEGAAIMSNAIHLHAKRGVSKQCKHPVRPTLIHTLMSQSFMSCLLLRWVTRT